ncbi:hypothetical protein [Mesorhizobium sp.]|uniref:hypothetical protein n=1 Tax=Mesorhizobium sp. TaxID=1871066 RepID=UPI000FE76B67|nr:hypothetical protein [Mesorhizobium sp.]RWA63285.1 MAG: hypothetical protein EOQ29_29600 [Mesorhizobium sp.]RWA78623.1 MAG: hypothetical protein EOQ30_29150 [Mesorhizobium sp.]RWB13414.1 MAG: hypothetical protein EOQ40_31705 [Mesorhizobium sp.]
MTDELRRSAAIGAALGEFAGMDAQKREDVAQLLAHLNKNGDRTAKQLKAALAPSILQACYG